MGIVVVHGNEPYNIDRYRKKALEGVDNPSMNVARFKGQFNEEVMNTCLTFPFLSDKRAVLLDCDTQKGLDTREFEEYLQNPSASCELFVTLRNPDLRTKVCKKLTSAGVMVNCAKYTDEAKVRKVLDFELKKRGASMENAVKAEFIRRINYLKCDDMNLAYMVNYIDAVTAAGPAVEMDTVKGMVPEFKEPNVFGLIRLLKEKRMDELMGEIGLIPPDRAIGIMSLLLRSYRVSFKARFYDIREVDSRARDEFSGMSADTLVRSMKEITDDIEAIKTGRITADIALKLCCGRLCALV